MENKKLKLPIGIQTFETIRTEGFVYVDKTKYLVDMINSGNLHFFARPRRFGKSVTVSTLYALFSGKKELFKGLYAEEFLNRPDFKPSPVIWLNMSKVTTSQGLQVMERSLHDVTMEVAKELGVDVPKDLSASDTFRNIIINAADKYQQKVVVLLDEYDAPYTNFVNEPDLAAKVRDWLRDYYVQIKSNEKYISFVFITGISKFAKIGVFSTLNITSDLSLNPKYAEMCGYTEDEIIKYFPDYLEDTAKNMNITPDELIEKMRHYYNGFSFDREAKSRLYNPFSTLAFFEEQEFFNFWMETGRSKIIADYLKNKNLTIEQFRMYPISRDFAKSPGDVDTAPPEAFLYQCGYLTLRADTSGNLSLDYPNTEVLNSMSALLSQNIVQAKGGNYNDFSALLHVALTRNDLNLLKDVLNSLLASIPYDDFSNAARQNIIIQGYKFPAQEWLYRSTILAFFRGCGIATVAEMHSNLGRADLVISYQGKTWVIELKVAYAGESPEMKAKEALQQIIENHYANQFPDAVCIGFAIDDTMRAITNLVVYPSGIKMVSDLHACPIF